jgi:arginyl-tRNA synthetase
MIVSKLKSTLAEALSSQIELKQEEIVRLLEKPKKPEHGELSLPCFQIAKIQKCNPVQAAKKLQETLEKTQSLPPGFAKCEAMGPFLNFHYDRLLFINKLFTQNTSITPIDKKIIVEFSSPNIAKPFHVGHLRTTFIGNAISRVYQELGYNTVRINHLGDWGTQFGFVWAGCELWGKPKEESVHALVEQYKLATALKERQEKKQILAGEESLPDVNIMARNYFLDLEAGKEYAVKFWQWCLDISMVYFHQIYKELNTGFDYYTGESFYSDKLPAVKEWLENSGLLVESQGALGVELGDDGFARIYTPDGRSLYLTRDIATVKYRAETFKFDRAVYVVGAAQSLHFRQITGVLKKLNYAYADRITHVPFGLVHGMKTRGTEGTVEVSAFLHEAFERAHKAYTEQVTKRPAGLDEHAVSEAVGLGAVVFTTLSRGRIKDVIFDWDTALSFQGDSGPYLLYAYARLNGIKERAKEIGVTPADDCYVPAAFQTKSAFELALVIDNFTETLERVVEEHEPSILATYAIDLSYAVSKAYLDLKVLGESKEIATARLTLFDKAQQLLGKSIELLGMRKIERM